MSEFATCPFCGSEAGVTTWFDANNKQQVLPECRNPDKCPARISSPSFDSREAALVAWNTRAPIDVVASLRAMIGKYEQDWREAPRGTGTLLMVARVQALKNAIKIIEGGGYE